jgi:hypothetical protein
LLGDLVESLGPELKSVDLGPAPPPGSSRLIGAAEIRQTLAARGTRLPGLKLPAAVRVVSAARRFSPLELEALLTPAITPHLRRGVTLLRAEFRNSLDLPSEVRVGRVEVPKPVRRAGPMRMTAVAELLQEDVVVRRLLVPLLLDVSQEAALPEVPRGTRMRLLVEHGSCQVAADAATLTAADVGEVISFRILRTQRVLKGRIESPLTARVVEE